MAFKEEMFVNHDEFDGCAGLEESETYEQWLQFEKRLKAKYKQNYVPSDVYLAITQQDKRVVGIIDYRHFLSPFLFQFGGNIGYSIRPMERQKGYGKQMLHLMLKKCKENGEKKVLITCDSENEASRRVILANGGVLENEVEDHVSLSQSGIIQRYWIDLEKEI